MDSLTIAYDWTWKQNVDLDLDGGRQFILMNESSDDEGRGAKDNSSQQEQEEEGDGYLRVDGDPTRVEMVDLKYLDEPGLQLYLSQEPELASLLSWFQPPEMFAAFTENLNSHLLGVIEKDFKSAPGQLQQVYTKKKFKENELQQWLGMHIWFGLFRFPSLSDYWRTEQWLRGGIEVCMQEGRFKFIDAHFLEYDPEQRGYPLAAVQEIRRKFRKVYRPDQEMVVVKSSRTLFLFDCETLFVVDQVLVSGSQKEERQVMELMASHHGRNHVIYFDRGLLTPRVVKALISKRVFPIGFAEEDEWSRTMSQGIYASKWEIMEKQNGKHLFFYPRIGSSEEMRKQHAQQVEKAMKRVTFMELYQSRFFMSQQQWRQEWEDESPESSPEKYASSSNELRVMFEEHFEGCVYNLFSFYHSILIPKEDYSYKKFRLEVARVLVGEKLELLERDRAEIHRRATMRVVERGMQSEKLSFGLMQCYDCECFHVPYFQPHHEQIKFCPVCMKFDGLSKPYYRCLVCEKQFMQGKIFLCLFPCFELFHRNPSEFIICEMGSLQGEDKYFCKSDALADAATLMKPPPPQPKPPASSNSRRSNGQPKANPNNPNNPNPARIQQNYHNYNWSYHRYEKARYDLDKSEKDLDQYLEALNPSQIEHLYRNIPVQRGSQERPPPTVAPGGANTSSSTTAPGGSQSEQRPPPQQTTQTLPANSEPPVQRTDQFGGSFGGSFGQRGSREEPAKATLAQDTRVKEDPARQDSFRGLRGDPPTFRGGRDDPPRGLRDDPIRGGDPPRGPRDDSFRDPYRGLRDDPPKGVRDDPYRGLRDEPPRSQRDDPYRGLKDDTIRNQREDTYRGLKEDRSRDEPYRGLKEGREDPYRGLKEDRKRDEPYRGLKEDRNREEPYRGLKEDRNRDEPYRGLKEDRQRDELFSSSRNDPFRGLKEDRGHRDDPYRGLKEDASRRDDPYRGLKDDTSRRDDPYRGREDSLRRDDPYRGLRDEPYRSLKEDRRDDPYRGLREDQRDDPFRGLRDEPPKSDKFGEDLFRPKDDQFSKKSHPGFSGPNQSFRAGKEQKLNDKMNDALFPNIDEREFQPRPRPAYQMPQQQQTSQVPSSSYQQMRQQQVIEEQKSPFEKFMDQVKKKKNPPKQEEFP